MSGRRSRAVAVLATVAIVIGILTLIASRNEPFTQAGGVRLWRLIFMNTFGSVLTLIGGTLGAFAAYRRSRGLVLAAGALFSIVALATLVTIGSAANFTGGRGDTFAFWLAMGIGPLALVLTPDPDERAR
jgi:hypothetical protein